MPCVEKFDKKYQIRPSVNRQANDPDCHYKTYIGNDGRPYTSLPNYKGIHTWKLSNDKQANNEIFDIDQVEKIKAESVQNIKNGPYFAAMPSNFNHATSVNSSLYLRHFYTNVNLPCPHITEIALRQIPDQELLQVWTFLEDAYCTKVQRAEVLGPFSVKESSYVQLRQRILQLTDHKALLAWTRNRIEETIERVFDL